MVEYKWLDTKQISDVDIPKALNKEAKEGYRFVAFHKSHSMVLLERQEKKK